VAGYVDGVLVPSLPLAPEHLDHLQRLTTIASFEPFKPWLFLRPLLNGAKHGEGDIEPGTGLGQA
jgi:hypothetical protein